MTVGFITCSGTSEKISLSKLPTEADLAMVRSIWIRSERPPDASAVADYENIWFSTEEIGRE